MPEDRFIHRKAGHSEKMTKLDDFEWRVWTTFLFAADDCGVMRASATSFQEANAVLDKRPKKAVQKAVDAVVATGLWHTFEHQGTTYLFQHDWQDWQHVRYPRASIHPELPPDSLAICSPAQRKLFRVRAEKLASDARKAAESFPEDSGNVPPSGEIFQHPAGAGGRERQRQRLTQEADGESEEANADEPEFVDEQQLPRFERTPVIATNVDAAIRTRAQGFLERFTALFPEYRNGAVYHMRPDRDYKHALGLVKTFPSERLEQLVVVFLNANEDFIQRSDRSVGVFASKATWCDEQLRKAEARARDPRRRMA